MLKQRNLTPPVKWRYCQYETGQWIPASGFLDLCENVLKHRVSNGLPRASENEVMEDVEHQICEQVDEYYAKNGTFKAAQLDAGSVYYAMKALAESIKNDSFVELSVAEDRADACSRCYHNRETTGCFGTCVTAFQELFQIMLGGRSTSKDSRLSSCAVCGCSNKATVHFSLDVLNQSIPEEKQTFFDKVPHCWRKTSCLNK